MGVLHVVASVALVWFICAECNRPPIERSLKTRLHSLEKELRKEILIISHQVNDLESVVNAKQRAGKVAPDSDVNVNVAKRLGDLEKNINTFSDEVIESIKRLARGLSEEKVEVRKTNNEIRTTVENQRKDIEHVQGRLDNQCNNGEIFKMRELNAQLLEAVEKLNATFVEFREDILLEREKLVKESPKAPCGPKWSQVEDRCYLYITAIKPWPLANMDCHNRGGKLAEPKTPELMDKLIGMLDDYVWIGGTDEDTEGVWVWRETNQHIPYSKWVGGKPQSAHIMHDCLEVTSNGWNDEHCLAANKYLCEKPMDI